MQEFGLEKTPLWRHLKDHGNVTAGALLHLFGSAEPPVDVDAIAARLGVEVVRVSSPGWSGAVDSSGNRAKIWLRQEDSQRRQRFTLAHELAHLLLHGDGVAFRDTNFQGGPLEPEANRFAAELLMPEWLVTRMARALGYDFKRLGEIFDVSPDAMRVRMSTLGLL